MDLPASFSVSRETRARLDIYVRELTRWQGTVNLVSPKSIPEVWKRHVADCLQLIDLAPDAQHWLDLGAGAGLPGLIVAAANLKARVVLIESDSRKCAFLRSTARLMGVEALIIEDRIEDRLNDLTVLPEIVTARGLAPLNGLLTYAQVMLANGTVGLFPKGRDFERELTAARESWTFDVELIESRTDPHARILRVTSLLASTAGTPTGAESDH